MATVHLRWLLSSALIVCGGGLGAQAGVTASVEVGAVNVRFADQASLGATTLSPALAWRSGWASTHVAGSASQLGTTGWSRQGNASLSLFTPMVGGGFLGEIGGSLGGSRFPDGATTAQRLASVRGHRVLPAGGLWIGAAAGEMYDGASWRKVRQGELGLQLDRPLGRVAMTATPSITDDSLRYTDLLVAVSRSLGVVDMAVSLGARAGAALPIAGGDQRTWGSVNLWAWVAPRTALSLGAGTYPVDVTQGFPAGRYVQAGIRFGGARTAQSAESADNARIRRVARRNGVDGFAVRRTAGDEIEIRVRADDASRVEVSGDLTAWREVALSQDGSGWWSVRFRTERSVVELMLRVDGMAWVVPPGATAVRDEFGGESGRLPLPAAAK